MSLVIPHNRLFCGAGLGIALERCWGKLDGAAGAGVPQARHSLGGEELLGGFLPR